MSSDNKIRALISALEPEVLSQVFADPYFAIRELKSTEEFENSFDQFKEGDFDLIVCGSTLGEGFANEFAQIMRQQCPGALLIFVTTKRDGFQKKTYIKNGFTSALLFPVDKYMLDEKVAELKSALSKSGRSYKSVFVMDIDAKTELPFPTYVYLPLNQKHVKFSAEKAAISQEKLDRLKKKDYGKVFIDKKNSSDFYAYSAEKLRSLGGEGVSQTEKEEKLRESVRNLFAGILDQSENSDYDAGKDMVASCQKVISNYITKGKTNNWYSQLVMAMGGAANGYDHAATVSSVAALIAVGTGHPKPEDVALAAFFHDIGRVDVPDELILKPESEWPPEMLEKYKLHSQQGVNIIKERRMVLSPEVEKAILQHHEKFNGTGFPKGLVGDRISIEAQLVSLADQFYYLTIVEEGKLRRTPKDALVAIQATGSISPSLLLRFQKLLGI